MGFRQWVVHMNSFAGIIDREQEALQLKNARFPVFLCGRKGSGS